MTGPYQLYRLYHGDGTSKTWGVCFNGDGTFTSVWGKTGALRWLPRLKASVIQMMCKS